MLSSTEDSTRPLLDVLKEQNPDCSNNTLRTWLLRKRVLVNEVPVMDAKTPISATDIVKLGHKTRPLNNKTTILFEDWDLIVIEKPISLLSVPTEKHFMNTLQYQIKRSKPKSAVYPVHRLDRDTSGVMIFAYSKFAKEHLKDQFERHSIEREYLGIVEGHIKEPKGTWESYLYDDPNYFVRETEDESLGKLAITHYEVLKTTKRLSLLKLSLETGRKNQIRVQASARGHPIVGDKKYGSMMNPIKRMALHAYSLSFIHPRTEKKMSFISYIPDEFQNVFKIKPALTS